ncbi:glycosyltransferase [Flavitalea sp. BT771]|uniref:glycosyltransferase family 2 protein n=1 Tax=Flavitalea sp. BT771 TaxID=3063329 RepID=UPI0026E2A78D|nr:glycosyltransferase [Flavitalea sp. BT771]MDO6429409.1 glycosyltransferase [Flavitalea sp. BT771]MDV6218463.1 glycosyltransferase [Flavitalea sp. BT771]
MNLTVLICTYNRGNLIYGTLQSLIEEQELPPDEIVVVNGGGPNDCFAAVEYWRARFPGLKHIKTKNINLAASRNIGLSHCSGAIVLQTDDDARPFPDWVKRMKEAHEKFPNAGVIGGEVVDASGRGLLFTVAGAVTFPWYGSIKEVRTVPGVNASYKKELIEQVGDYNTALFRGEDVDYNWRAIKAGWKILYVPGICVYHCHRPTWTGLLYQHFMYGRAYYLVRRQWPDMYSVYPRSFRSARDLARMIYFLISPVHNSIIRLKRIKGWANRLFAFLPAIGVGYMWMTGVFVQLFQTLCKNVFFFGRHPMRLF